MTRRLEDLHSEFEQGIFLASYDSSLQRRRRSLALALLSVKHTLRGLLFSWPAYVPGLAAFYSETAHAAVYLLLLVPALWLSLHILLRGVRDDYRDRVKGLLLGNQFARRLVFPAAL
jgi:hypothetical protein